MASAVDLQADYSATELRRLAATTKNANQSRRLLSLAAVVDGMNRTEAARIGGMDRQTLGTGCIGSTHTVRTVFWTAGPRDPSRASGGATGRTGGTGQTGPDRAVHGV